jgi:hypothetical protein
MIERIENLTYRGNTTALAQIEILRVWVEPQLGTDGLRIAHTHHKVSSVFDFEGVETVEMIRQFNMTFTYKGGDVYTESMSEIKALISRG